MWIPKGYCLVPHKVYPLKRSITKLINKKQFISQCQKWDDMKRAQFAQMFILRFISFLDYRYLSAKSEAQSFNQASTIFHDPTYTMIT